MSNDQTNGCSIIIPSVPLAMDRPAPDSQPPSQPHAHAPAPNVQQPVTPSRTLYVRNLTDKIPKQRLRRLLYSKFSAHGRVVWIVAEKTMKLRGQAFVTFEHQSGATAALRSLQANEFMGKSLMIAYARNITNRTNTALPRSKRKQQQEKDQTTPMQQAQQQIGNEPMEQIIPPNNILFVQNLASNTNLNDLTELFSKFSGFTEIRSVPGNQSIAFVEYQTDHDAAIAMSGLNQQPVGNPPQPMSVNFAKK